MRYGMQECNAQQMDCDEGIAFLCLSWTFVRELLHVGA